MEVNSVTERLTTGTGATSREDVQALWQAGVRTVIGTQAERDDTELFVGSGIVYHCNGTGDDGQTKPNAWFDKSIRFAPERLALPSGKIHVHCGGGINRGPSMAYAILRAMGVPAKNAELLMNAARPQAGMAYKHDAERAVKELGWVA